MNPFKLVRSSIGAALRLGAAAEELAPQPGRRTAGGRRLFMPERLDSLVVQLTELPDPDTVLEKLGRTRADLRGMEGDDEIAQCLETRRDALIATPWRLEPGDGEVVEWIAGQLDRHLDSMLSAIWSAIPYGYSVMRPVYEKPEAGAPASARIGGLADVEELEFERFTVWGDGRWHRRDEATSIPLPLADWETDYLYFITTRRRTKRNPYGEAILSRAYWPWFFRHNTWRFWMQALERFGTPMLLGKTQGNVDDMADQLAQAVQDAVIAVGHGDEVVAINNPGTGDAFDKAEARLVQRIQKLILGQTLTSSVDGKGSYAAAKVHDAVRHDKRNADLRTVCPTVQRLVNALTMLRFGPGVDAPKFVMEDGTGLQKDRAERDADLVNAGAVALTEEYFLRAYDYEVGDFTIPEQTPPGQPLATLARTGAGGRGIVLAKPGGNGQRFSADQEAVEDLVSGALDQAASPIPAATIRSAILAAKDEADLIERLEKLYRGNDNEAFQTLMAQALFTADVLGYETAENRVGV